APLAEHYFHQMYLPASYNWSFHARYASADHLLNAFDYGHAILYERLLTAPRDAARIDARDFDYVVHHVLAHPSHLVLPDDAIAPNFNKLVPEVAVMFDWAHMLPRQLYDLLSDPHIRVVERERRA